ncbi:MAG: hypothetical protein IAG10_07980 [Planctomycetaceae bacterium]|nr:hypothetical protein [Planctomycetaceae bacterium]
MLLSVGLVVAMMARPERIVVVERVVTVNEPTPQQVASVSEPNGPAERHDIVTASTSRGSQYFTQRQIAVMQSIESMPARSKGQVEAEPSHEQSPLTARELWKTWSEENQKPQPTQTSEPDWLRWLNPETWL